ncbi:MAG TPA: CoA transferase [Candidatus Angelobacter sp.]|nr:CoA transferase [Candidatus Angelobacter sp.]
MTMASDNTNLLQGIKVVSLCINTPGPLAAAELASMGAAITKVEPPAGDPLKTAARSWYDALARGQTVISLDLKDSVQRGRLDDLLAESDLLLASFRPSALERLGLDWQSLHRRFPRLCFAGIIGYPAPDEERSGHDLTYLADTGLVAPPAMPLSLYVDLAGGQRCAAQSLALLLSFARTGQAGCAWISLYECAEELAAPLRAGLTQPSGGLGGGSPFYGLYQTSDGWIAIAALEPHFARKLLSELGMTGPDRQALAHAFAGQTAEWWDQWAAARGLPLSVVRTNS